MRYYKCLPLAAVLLAEQALAQGSGSRYVKRYQTEFAVAIVIAIIFLCTSIFFLYKWFATSRLLRAANKECKREKSRADRLEDGTSSVDKLTTG